MARYDAFISYSHAVDGRLAPAIRNGLQRLAKPWNKRRALNVFLDQHSLEVSHGLRDTLHAKLRNSDRLVVLLSEDSVRSEWMGQEIAIWTADRSPETILLVLTQGELVWGDGDWDMKLSTSLPPGLRGLYSEEPLWVDLRWARDEPDLDIRTNNRLKNDLAMLAAPLHGKSKEDIVGEDLELFRRAQRLRRAAVTGLAVLLVAAVVAALAAVHQRDIAREQTALALERGHAIALRYAATLIDRNQLGRARDLLASTDPSQRGWEWRYLMATCGVPPLRLDLGGTLAFGVTDADLVIGDAPDLATFLSEHYRQRRGLPDAFEEGNDRARLLHPDQRQEQLRSPGTPIVRTDRWFSSKNGHVAASVWSAEARALLQAIDHDAVATTTDCMWLSPDESVLLVQLHGDDRGLGVFYPRTLSGETYGQDGLWAFPLPVRDGAPELKVNRSFEEGSPDFSDRFSSSGALGYGYEQIEAWQRRGSTPTAGGARQSWETIDHRGTTRLRWKGVDLYASIVPLGDPENNEKQLALLDSAGTVVHEVQIPQSVWPMMPNQMVELTPHEALGWILIDYLHPAGGGTVLVVDLESGEVLFEARQGMNASREGFAWSRDSREIATFDSDGHFQLREGFNGPLLSEGTLPEFPGGFGIPLSRSPDGTRLAIGPLILDAKLMTPLLTLHADANISPDWRTVTITGRYRNTEVLDLGLLEPGASREGLALRDRLYVAWLDKRRGSVISVP